jgi:hypothetical protein
MKLERRSFLTAVAGFLAAPVGFLGGRGIDGLTPGTIGSDKVWIAVDPGCPECHVILVRNMSGQELAPNRLVYWKGRGVTGHFDNSAESQ